MRIGGTVHRSRGPNSEFSAELLTYLNSIGFLYAPRYIGTDEEGRDVLEYVAGNTTNHPSRRSEAAYSAGGRMLRALHDATAGHRLAAGAECVAHGDPGPFNAIFRDGLPVAFIDWDTAHPGERIHDVAYMAWTWCIQAAGEVPIEAQVRHLRDFVAGYGFTGGPRLLDAIVAAQTGMIDRESQVRGDPARRAHARTAVEWARSDRTLVLDNLEILRAAL
ncbi:MAG TPA: aminoglycoside phosphotransferase family protein [Mycobacteriales bacterium]|nr:aminoglycoside phosphotransferase family protein [Mycobacteriales bacterium]